jgi:hypothetical protein
MSEDEDERDAEGKLTGCFLTRPWMWASDEVSYSMYKLDNPLTNLKEEHIHCRG